MAVALTANFSSQVSNSLRENFSDIVATIDPTEVPVQANIGRIEISNPEGYEHQLDSLNTPTNAGFEDGFDFEDLTSALTTRVRLKMRAQVQAKAIKISNRLEETDKAGVDSEISYQLARRAEDMRRDCENTITTLREPVPSAAGIAPLTGGIPSWLTTNVDYNTQNAPTLGADGEPNWTAGTATARGITETALLALLRGSYDAGGNIDMWSVSPAVKQLMSLFFFTANARIATQYQDAGAKPGRGLQVVGAVDFYVSDFGVIAIVPNRFHNDPADIFMLDTDMWEIGTFRGYEVHEMGLMGDYQSYMLVHDFGLVSRDEAASALFAEASQTIAMAA